MEKAKKQFSMREIRLRENHRFKDNPKMMLLDRNIRLNAENPLAPQVEDNVEINLEVFSDQDDEAQWVLEKVEKIIVEDADTKIAVLARGRGLNIERVISRFDSDKVDYFYGLYTDEDPVYLNFHRECLNIFILHIKDNIRITKLI